MVTINNARKILQRVDTLPLYLHAYAFHLNMRLERVLPADLLDIASEIIYVASKSMFWMASVFLW
ncbi:putative sugar isomerase [Escherichia coli]|uniref:Putative sugar isomerase n=1 Tax=Escherichia coli TaxID=562 RepID=A0A376MME8_ECOLX|nr:putative sugar isomerase [Escherichia coli]